ncbi:hypothetical protein AMECASPLE_003425 [Ameca splendens]|uniref:Uncharacterized protein n=1 Tax=Ameca splendens TaxID=208324 RepID=A0ABV0YL79_9TELE
MLKPGDPSGSAFLKVDPSYLQHWQQLFPQAQLKAPLAPPPPPPDRLSIAVDTLRPSRLHTHLLASTHCTSSSSSSSTSASAVPSSSSAAAAAAAAVAAALTPSSSVSISTSTGLSQLPVPQQIALFGQALAPVCTGPVGPGAGGGGGGPGPGGAADLVVVVPPDNQQGHNTAVELLHQAKEQSCGGVGVVSSSVKSSSIGGSSEESGRFKLTSEELDFYLYGQQRMEIIPLSNHTGEVNNRTSKHTNPHSQGAGSKVSVVCGDPPLSL